MLGRCETLPLKTRIHSCATATIPHLLCYCLHSSPAVLLPPSPIIVLMPPDVPPDVLRCNDKWTWLTKKCGSLRRAWQRQGALLPPPPHCALLPPPPHCVLQPTPLTFFLLPLPPILLLPPSLNWAVCYCLCYSHSCETMHLGAVLHLPPLIPLP